jgi:acyl-CoA thioester hydrolase
MTMPRQATTLEGSSRYLVYYEDTDFSGYVYHANYLKFFERAREDLLGIEQVRTMYEEGLHFVVAHMTLEFKAPARHGDLVEVKTTMALTASPIVEVTQVASIAGAERPLVTAAIRLAAVGSDGRPRRIPEATIARWSARS